jgi:hypothetical protein
MTVEQQNAFLQEHLDQSHMFREYGHLKNGIGDVPVRNVIKEPAPKPVPPVPQIPTNTSERIVEKTTVTESPTSLVKNLLMGGALLAGGLGTGIGAMSMFGHDTPAPIVIETQPGQQPVAPTPAIDPKYGDLLKYLRENGYNLPPQ